MKHLAKIIRSRDWDLFLVKLESLKCEGLIFASLIWAGVPFCQGILHITMHICILFILTAHRMSQKSISLLLVTMVDPSRLPFKKTILPVYNFILKKAIAPVSTYFANG